MRAMVLAAGLGTRLRPLTDDRPKALVEIKGRTLLDITLARLRAIGIHEVIVNAHHFADRLIEYLQTNKNFGMHIQVSREDVLLDTGGGLKKAAQFFLSDSSDEPFLIHNVDVLSTIDLELMLRTHRTHQGLATLAVMQRKTSRYLLFENSLLCGRRIERGGTEPTTELVHPARYSQALAFCGIHVASPRLLQLLTEDGAFSIIDAYLRLAASGQKIQAFRADEYYWRDLGKPQNIAQATEDVARGVISIS
jgi:NDP-sugar pyrophosphorylase family protein